VRIGVLASQQESEWVLPSFTTPKKDGRVRWISNLHQLNKVITRKQYPLLIITDILRKCSRYKFSTKLDVSMQYYRFELDEESQDLSTIITPFGKNNSLRLPMGLKCSPVIAHCSRSHGECIVSHQRCYVYIDDVGAFSSAWKLYINLLATNLCQLSKNGFTINPLKCEWVIKETD
jgi:hypothetical protein